MALDYKATLSRLFALISLEIKGGHHPLEVAARDNPAHALGRMATIGGQMHWLEPLPRVGGNTTGACWWIENTVMLWLRPGNRGFGAVELCDCHGDTRVWWFRVK